MKKTALNDDASIYQKRDEESERQKWNRLNSRQRRQYFLDYYLLKIAVGLALFALIGYLLYSFLRPKDQTVLYVAVVDEQLDEEKKAALTEELNQLFQADGKKQKVVIDDLFYMQDGAVQKLQVYLYNHQIDVLIADEDTYEKLAGYGFLQNMAELPEDTEQTKYEPYYRYAAGYQESGETSFEDHETGQGELLPYGVDLSGSRKFNDMKNYIRMPVFSVAAEAPNQEYAVKFLDYLMGL